MITITELRDRLIREKLFDKTFPIVGAMEKEVEAIRANQGVRRLPQKYVDFALLMGNGSGYLFRDTHVQCNTKIAIKSMVLQIFAHEFTEHNFELPDDAFIYQVHPDFFAYFRTHETTDNPIVYRFNIHFPQNPQLIESFSKHLEEKYDEVFRNKKEQQKYDYENAERRRKAWIQAELARRRRVEQMKKDEKDS